MIILVGFEKIEELFSKKYSLSILRFLIGAEHGAGFNALLKDIPGATPRIISARLKELEALKLVQKNLVLGAKPKIEYRATPKTIALKKTLTEAEKWGKEL